MPRYSSNVQIPNLPVAVGLSGQEQLEIVQAGTSRRTSINDIVGFSVGPTGPTGPTGAVGPQNTNYSEQSTAPNDPVLGDRWLNTDTGIEFTYLSDVDGAQWVETNSVTFLGPTGPTGPAGSSTFPSLTTAEKDALSVPAGTVVFDTTLSKLSVFTGAAWETITSV
jgi:hypothetical protein